MVLTHISFASDYYCCCYLLLDLQQAERPGITESITNRILKTKNYGELKSMLKNEFLDKA